MKYENGSEIPGEHLGKLANPTLEICPGGSAGLSFYHIKHRIVVLCGSCVRHVRLAAQVSQA
jgi:hypothetical protein